MNQLRAQIPNLFTFLNLSGGVISIYFSFNDQPVNALIAIGLGIFCDFFDGLIARALGVAGELGKQLDSLADVITSGLAPGFMMYFLLGSLFGMDHFVIYISLLIPISSAYRLAKFNIDSEQSHSFTGMPTPANALMLGGLIFWSSTFDSKLYYGYFTLFMVSLGIYMLNSPIKMFALKFKQLDWSSNKQVYLFLLISCGLILIFKAQSISLIFFNYILLSLINTRSKGKSKL
jgi:CDP-diacylglycerol--serine O-phosphatidyltransferase